MAAKHAFEYAAEMPGVDTSAPARLLSSIYAIQQRREDRARQAKLDQLRVQAEQRAQQQYEDERAAKLLDLQVKYAGMGERPQPEAQSVNRDVTNMGAAPPPPEAIPEATATIGGQTIHAPLLSHSDILNQAVEHAKAVAQAQHEASTMDQVQLTPQMVAGLPETLRPFFQPGMKVSPPNLSTALGALVRADNQQPKLTHVAPGGFLLDENNKVVFHAPDKTPAAGATDFSPEDVARFPTSWRDVSEGTPTRESYSTRSSPLAPKGAQSVAIAAAQAAGRQLPTKKGAEEAQAAQSAIAQAERVKALLEKPGVAAGFGQLGGRITGAKQAGYFGTGAAKNVDKNVSEARTALSRFAAKDRHELFGSALTRVETQFGIGFEPDLNQPLETNIAKLDSYINGLKTNMDAQWGSGPTTTGSGPTPAGTAPTTTGGGLSPRVKDRLKALGYPVEE